MVRWDCCLLDDHNNENLYFHVLVVKVQNVGFCWGCRKFVVQKLLWFLSLCLKRREKQTTDGLPARLVRFLKTDPAPLQKIGRHMSALDPSAALNCLVLKSRCLQPLSLCLSFLPPPPSPALLSPSRSLSLAFMRCLPLIVTIFIRPPPLLLVLSDALLFSFLSHILYISADCCCFCRQDTSSFLPLSECDE